MTYFLFLFHRQYHSKYRSLANFAFQFYGTVHCGYNMLYNGKAKAGTADVFIAGFIHHIKALENLFLMMRCNADARIRHFKNSISAVFAVAERYIHRSVRSVVFDCVGDKVAEQIPHLLVVCRDDNILCCVAEPELRPQPAASL